MSFFGITALGPPNIFKSSLVNALGKYKNIMKIRTYLINLICIGVNIYSDEEFLNAFKKVDKD